MAETTLHRTAGAVPAPEPELTPAQMIERATGLRSQLLAAQDECERLRTLPESTRQALIDGGFFRILQPRRFGGYEFDLETFVRVMSEVARGCPSSGWTLALTSGHAHTITRWPFEVQVEAFGEAGEFRSAFVGAPTGTATPVEGGYQVRGAWDYGTGCDVATHFMATVRAEAGDGREPVVMVCLLPRRDFSIVPNWDALGLRGTGSHRVVVEDRFVPAARALSLASLHQPARPPLHPNPMYVGPIGVTLFMELAAVALGTARGALDEYEASLRSRTTLAPPGMKRFEHHEYQEYFGEASGLIEVAEAGIQRAAREYTELGRRDLEEDERFPDLEARRMLLYQQRAVGLAVEAVDLIFPTAGTSATRERLGRYFRDMSTIRTHLTMQYDRTAENFAKVYFGLSAASPM